MSTSIRLTRTGRKNLPAFRVVVANTRSKQNGKFLDTIGSYNPAEKPQVLTIDKDKLKFWQDRGAIISKSVQELVDGTYKFVAYPSAKKLKREAAKNKATGGEKSQETKA